MADSSAVSAVNLGPTTLKVRLLGAEAFPAAFATNMAITATEHEVTVAFFEAVLPTGPDALQGVKEVPARCVARIVISAGRFKEIAELWGKVLEQHQQAKAQGEAVS